MKSTDDPKHFRPTIAVIDLGRIAENFRILRASVAPGVFICPMVKANAYGHGDVEVAKRLRRERAEHLGVGLIEEGLRLRLSGDVRSILHFGMFDAAGAEALIANQITPVISSRACLEDLILVAEKLQAKSLLKAPIRLHLKVNTGMNRLGTDEGDVANVARRIEGGVKKGLFSFTGLGTHFARSEDFNGDESGSSKEQLRRFRLSETVVRAAGLNNFKLHVANSGATLAIARLRKKDSSLDDLGIRPGLSIYGMEPDAKIQSTFGVRPTFKFLSRITHVQNINIGEGVSYGLRWRAARKSRIGIIPCGYADGYRRGLSVPKPSGQSPMPPVSVIVGGRHVPVVGTICMDYFMCDLTEVESVGIGDVVILIGEENGAAITVQELADRVETIPYEILTGISERVPRVYNDVPG